MTFYAYTLHNIAHKKTADKQGITTFTKIRQSITANPFSRQRAVADSRISDLAPNTKPEKLISAAIEVALKSRQEFILSSRADVNLFDGWDRHLIDGLFLFIIFHRYRDQFDCHITQHIKVGVEPFHLDFNAKIYHNT